MIARTTLERIEPHVLRDAPSRRFEDQDPRQAEVDIAMLVIGGDDFAESGDRLRPAGKILAGQSVLTSRKPIVPSSLSWYCGPLCRRGPRRRGGDDLQATT